MRGNHLRFSPDCVDFVQPWPFLLPVACTCSGDFETKFSPAIKKKIERSIECPKTKSLFFH